MQNGACGVTRILLCFACLCAACGRKPAPSVTVQDASTSTLEWSAEQLLHARGMSLRQTGLGKGVYKLRSDGCVRVTFRGADAGTVLSSATVRLEGENGVVPAAGPICGVRGDEWTVEAGPHTAWALWATDSNQKN